MSTVTVNFNERFFDEILNSTGVQALCQAKAQEALAIAIARAPVKTGNYREHLGIEKIRHAHRTTWMVVGHAPHTMLVESETQNLARAIKAVK